MNRGTRLRWVALASLNLAAGLAAAIALAGCGGDVAKPAQAVASPPATGASFAWLRPAAPPAGWRQLPIPNGATMSYPPGWRHVHGDAGTASAILGGAGGADRGRVLGYLNLTPLQGPETLANWGHFRVDHNGDEGDREVMTLAVGSGLRFRTGHGTCVRDVYTTKTGARYIELACLVKGRSATSVIVGASPPSAWPRVSPLLERAISTFST